MQETQLWVDLGAWRLFAIKPIGKASMSSCGRYQSSSKQCVCGFRHHALCLTARDQDDTVLMGRKKLPREQSAVSGRESVT